MTDRLSPHGARGAAVVVVVLLCTVAACRARSAEPAPERPLTIGVAGLSNAHPSIAARGATVAIVWAASSDTATDIYSAVSGDGGQHFGEPRRVNDTAGDASPSGEQPPRVAIGPDAVHVVWPSRRGGAVIRYARSSDGGSTFTPSVTVPSEGLRGARGWESLAVDAAGVVHLVWLDGRASAAAAADSKPGVPHAPMHVHGAPGRGGAARPPVQQDIYHASWKAGGPVHESRIASNVCFCCKTAVAASPQGISAAWRHVYPGSIRDIAFARSPDGRAFTEPARVSSDGWHIEACPEDGPAMFVDDSGAAHIAWPTLLQGTADRKGIFYASSSDGRTFTERVRLDSGDTDPAHPQIAMDGDGRAAVVWDEVAGKTRSIVIRAIDRAGALDPPETLASETGASHPVIAAARDGLIVAWSAAGEVPDQSAIHVLGVRAHD